MLNFQVKNEEGEEDGVDSPVLDELEIEIKAGEKDLGEEDFKEEKRVEDEAEVRKSRTCSRN